MDWLDSRGEIYIEEIEFKSVMDNSNNVKKNGIGGSICLCTRQYTSFERQAWLTNTTMGSQHIRRFLFLCT